jgi:hypothetical protein
MTGPTPDRRTQLALENDIRNPDAWWAAQLAEAVRMLLATDPCA